MECLIQDAEKRIIIMITKTTRTKIKEHYSAKKPKFTWAFFYAQTKFVSLRSVANNERRWCFKILGQCFEI